MNTAMDSLSLLQDIFQSQDSNWGLLHCRMLSPSCFVLFIFMPLTGAMEVIVEIVRVDDIPKERTIGK